MSSLEADAVWDAWCATSAERPELSPEEFAREYAMEAGEEVAEVLATLGTLLAVEEAAPLPSLLSVLQPDLEAEQRFAGFRLVRELGEGSTGLVYEAVDEREEGAGERVALKILNPLVGGTRTRREVLKREATIAAQLHHEGIVRLVASGVERGYTWIATELVEGEALGAWIDADLPAERRRELAREVGVQACRALEHAHAKGLVHRDLKPANLVREPGGRVKILDFGLAHAEGAAFAVSRTGEAVGTPLYMPPEQLRGEREVDGRADVYSLGLVLLELATGRRLTIGAGALGTLERIARGAVRFPGSAYRGLPADLAGVLSRCLEPNPDDRYASAAALCADLEALRGGRKPRLRRIGAAERLALWVWRNPGQAAAVAGSAVVTVLLVLWVWRMAVRVPVTVDVWPRDAAVAVDGELRESSPPLPLNLRPGRHRVEVRVDGRLHEASFDVRPGERRSVSVPCAVPYRQPPSLNSPPADEPFAWVQVAARPADRVDFDRQFPIELEHVGGEAYPCADGIQSLALPYGDHEVRVRAEGYRERSVRVRVDDGRLRCVQVFLDPEGSPWHTLVVGGPLDPEIADSLELENLELRWETTQQDGFTETLAHRLGLGAMRPDRVGVASYAIDLPFEPAEVQVLRLADPEIHGEQDPESGLRLEAGPASDRLVAIGGWFEKQLPGEHRIGHPVGMLVEEAQAALNDAFRDAPAEPTRLHIRWTLIGPKAWAIRTNAVPRRRFDGRVLWDPALVLRARPHASEPEPPPFDLTGVPVPNGAAPSVLDLDQAAFAMDGGSFEELLRCSASTGMDTDGDGVSDLALGWATGDGWTVQVRSGRDGVLLKALSSSRPGDMSGISIALVHDADGDGLADLLVGGPQHVARGNQLGYLRLYSSRTWQLLGEREGAVLGEQLGQWVAPLGDVDGDGRPEAAAGSWEYAAGGWGHARIITLPDLEDVHVFRGREQCDHFGNHMAPAGDVDGDGFPDLLVGAFNTDLEWWDSGAAYVYSGRSGEQLFEVRGRAVSSELGRRVAPAGDVDRDGRADFLVDFGGPNELGGVGGAVVFSGATGDPLRAYLGPPGVRLRLDPSPAPDLDQDGLPEHVLAAPARPPSNRASHRLVLHAASTGESLLELSSTKGRITLAPGPVLGEGAEARRTLFVGLAGRSDGRHSPVLVDLGD